MTPLPRPLARWAPGGQGPAGIAEACGLGAGQLLLVAQPWQWPAAPLCGPQSTGMGWSPLSPQSLFRGHLFLTQSLGSLSDTSPPRLAGKGRKGPRACSGFLSQTERKGKAPNSCPGLQLHRTQACGRPAPGIPGGALQAPGTLLGSLLCCPGGHHRALLAEFIS